MSKKKHPVLDLPMGENDADAKTVREYLKAIVREVVLQEEGFSGKRPFGNSGWMVELAQPLIKAGLVNGMIDREDGHVEHVHARQVEKVLIKAIKDL